MGGCIDQLTISRIETENLGSPGYNAFLRNVAILGYYIPTVLLLFYLIVEFSCFYYFSKFSF